MADDDASCNDSPPHSAKRIGKFQAERVKIEAVTEAESTTIDDISKTNLIVNYLPQTLSDDGFRSMFSQIGPLRSCKVVRDPKTGYCHGYGFVNYASISDAAKAILVINGLQLQNKTIKVSYARPKTDKTKNSKLFVSGLLPSTDDAKLAELFSKFGDIIQTRVLVDPSTNVCTGAGFVLFSTTDECELAIKSMNEVTPPGFSKWLNVKYSHQGAQRTQDIQKLLNLEQQEQQPSNAGPMRTDRRFRARQSPIAGKEQGVITDPSLADRNELGLILFVRNFPISTDEQQLFGLFSPFGCVCKVNIMRNSSGSGKGFGFVTMKSDDDAVQAVLKLNRSTFGGREIEVRFKMKAGQHVTNAGSSAIPSLMSVGRARNNSPDRYFRSARMPEPLMSSYEEDEGFYHRSRLPPPRRAEYQVPPLRALPQHPYPYPPAEISGYTPHVAYLHQLATPIPREVLPRRPPIPRVASRVDRLVDPYALRAAELMDQDRFREAQYLGVRGRYANTSAPPARYPPMYDEEDDAGLFDYGHGRRSTMY